MMNLKVLLVDDNKDFLNIIGRLFRIKEPSSHLTTLNDTQDIFDKLTINELNSFDVIISDYKMNPINGVELCKILKKKDVKTPFILISSQDLMVIHKNICDYLVEAFILKNPNIELFYEELLLAIPNSVSKFYEKEKKPSIVS